MGDRLRAIGSAAEGEDGMTLAYETAESGPVIHELEGAAPHAGSRWMRPFEVIAAALLAVMIGMILVNVASRYVLSMPIIWADEIAAALS